MSPTVTLVAGPLGGMQPGRPVDDWDEVPVDARDWADGQAESDEENEMVTVVEGDRRAELGGEWPVFVTQSG